MRAIILAAGMGTRLTKYTKNKPKGLLDFGGLTLVERQIEVLRSCGINDIVILTGYYKDEFYFNDVRYIYNSEFFNTNMLHSFFLARDYLNDDIILCYGDIIYEEKVLKSLIYTKANIGVVVDTEWKEYWNIRYNNLETDLESLKINKKNYITNLGKSVQSSDKIDARYVGLIKFSKSSIYRLNQLYIQLEHRAAQESFIWPTSGNGFMKGYITDFLNYIISNNYYKVKAVKIENGWLEFDTNYDYEIYINMLNNGSIKKLINIV